MEAKPASFYREEISALEARLLEFKKARAAVMDAGEDTEATLAKTRKIFADEIAIEDLISAYRDKLTRAEEAEAAALQEKRVTEFLEFARKNALEGKRLFTELVGSLEKIRDLTVSITDLRDAHRAKYFFAGGRNENGPTGNFNTSPLVRLLATPEFLRKGEVQSALEWLPGTVREFDDIVISEENILRAGLAEDRVPPPDSGEAPDISMGQIHNLIPGGAAVS
jgi:hypothetical protein